MPRSRDYTCRLIVAGGVALIVALYAAHGAADSRSLWLAQLTTTEVAAALEDGVDTAIVATGGIEQNGPFVALDKHDLIVAALSERLARALGHTLVAPVVSFVPEGDIAERSLHMAHAGTVSARESTYRALLEDIVRSLLAHGFKRVLLLGDSAGNQAGLAAVADALDTPDRRVVYLAKVYDYEAVRTFLRKRGFVEGVADVHEELAFSAQLAYCAPSALRLSARTHDDVWTLNGVSMDVNTLTALGDDILTLRTELALSDAHARLREPAKVAPMWLARTPLRSFFDAGDRMYIVHFASALGLAVAVFAFRVRRRNRSASLRAFLFPRAIWLHPSARLDYLIWLLNIVLLLLLPASFGTAIAQLSAGIQRAMAWALPPLQLHLPDPVLSIAYALCVLLVSDFALYLAHFLQHKVPALWEFHAVHHSARVLTPFTMQRLHPVDALTNIAATALAIAFVDGAFGAVFSGNYSLFLIGGIHALLFAFHFTGYHLRHSHVWLSYGPRVSRWLISPAQHQLHHSRLAQHREHNFGLVLACWDTLFGTLYVPEEREPLVLGIEGREGVYTSLGALYFEPIRRLLGLWLSRSHSPEDASKAESRRL